jgi:catechol 2,3-dioxygenase
MLPGDLTLGPVALTVADLDRSLDYYGAAIGLRVLDQGDGRAALGTDGTPLLELTEIPGAPPADGYSGLFHFALLVPERVDLARWLAHAARDQVPMTGASDHFVSEALYLRDPDHHGIEIYWDRPREQWEGQVDKMGTWPLDLRDLIDTLPHDDDEFTGLPAGTRMGHVHLRVADIDATVAFYRDALGFELMAQLGPQAAFFAAGGYHHHFGGNVWESRGALAAPPGSATLQHATVVFPDGASRDAAVERVRAAGYEAGDALLTDPSGNRLLLACH